MKNKIITAWLYVLLMSISSTAFAIDSLTWLINNCTTCFPAYDFITTGFTVNKSTGYAPASIVFTNSSYPNYSTNKTAMSFTTFTWDFGDGSNEIGGNPTHIYSNPGIYTVRLTASRGTIGVGDRNIATNTITVLSPAATQASLSQQTCIFNWAENYYPQFFPQGNGALFTFPPYTYRFYTATNYYLAFSSNDNNLYYMSGLDGVIRSAGDVSIWLSLAGC